METKRPVVMNEHDAAYMLDLSVTTLRAWRNQKKGPRFVRFGRSVRYLEADIQEFIHTHVVKVGDKK